jgi:hypothetical protein
MPINASTLHTAACAGILVLSAPASGNPLQDQAAPLSSDATDHDGRRMPASCSFATEFRRDKYRGVVWGMDANGNPVAISIYRSKRFPGITTSVSE